MDLERARGFINYVPSSEVDETLSSYERFTSLWDRIVVQDERTQMIIAYDESGDYKVAVWCDTVPHTECRLREIGAEWYFKGESYFSEKLAMSSYDTDNIDEPGLSTLAKLEDSVTAAEQFTAAFEARLHPKQ